MIDEILVSYKFTFAGMKVLTVGEMLFDDLPDGRRPGGGPFNAAAHLCAMGTPAGILTAVGNDELGEALITLANAHGVNTSFIQRNALPTSTVKVSILDHGDANYEIVQPIAWDAISLPPKNELAKEKPDIVAFWLLGIRDVRSFSTAKAFAKTYNSWQKRPTVMVDLGLRPPFCERPQVEFLLHEADVLKLNTEELSFFTEMLGLTSNPLVLAKAYSIKTILLTSGSEPAKSYSRNAIFEATGPAVQVKDTVGCGDAFLAGYMHAMLKDLPEQDRLQTACDRGSFAASRAGGLP